MNVPHFLLRCKLFGRSTTSKLRLRMDGVYRLAIRVISSDYFFYGVIAISVLQALWYALSFVPWINDEVRHVANIVIYAQQLSPFLEHQPTSWDYLGAVTRDGSFMFYYLMSWPLRVVRLATYDPTVQVVSLRLVCMTLFALGLVVYRRALLELATLPRSIINLLLLCFVSIPTVAILPGTVNYDNLVFLLFAGILLLAIRSVKSSTVSVRELAIFLALGLGLSVIKWTSVALFAPTLLYVGWNLFRKYKTRTSPVLLARARRLPRLQLLILAGILLVGLGLFVARPVTNLVQYGSPEPGCSAVIGVERCLQSPDYAAYAALTRQKAADFRPNNPVGYLLSFWVSRMINTASNVFEQANTELPVPKILYSVLGFLGGVCVLMTFKQLVHRPTHRLLLSIVVVYVLLLLLDEYHAYITYGVPVATRARYLIPILPIGLYFVAFSVRLLFGKYRQSLLIAIALVVMLNTQGGGIVTYALTTPEGAYWPNSTVHRVDDTFRQILLWTVKR